MIASTSRVLILDSNLQQRSTVEDILSAIPGAANIVMQATTIDEAVEVCAQRPDCVLMSDEWSEHQLARFKAGLKRLKLVTPIPLLMLTDHSHTNREDDWVREVFADIIPRKGLSPEMLDRSIRHSTHEVAMAHLLAQRTQELNFLRSAIESSESQTGEMPSKTAYADRQSARSKSDPLEHSVSQSAAPWDLQSLTPPPLPTEPPPIPPQVTPPVTSTEPVTSAEVVSAVSQSRMPQQNAAPQAIQRSENTIPMEPAQQRCRQSPGIPERSDQLVAETSVAPQVVSVSKSEEIEPQLIAPPTVRPSGVDQVDAQTADVQTANRDTQNQQPGRQSDCDFAGQLQTRVLPSGSPLVEGLDIAGLSRPALATGGDFYDYVKFKDQRLAIAVGDASGEGIDAAAAMMATRCYLRALAPDAVHPGAVLEQVNDLLVEDTRDNDFVTIFLLGVDPHSRSMVYAAAGQQAYVLRADGEIEILKSTSMPIGIRSETVIRSAGPVTLNNGEMLVLATDGIIKTHSPAGESFGLDRLRRSVWKNRAMPARMIASLLEQDCRDFSDGRPLTDDFTAVIVKHHS